jgi:shikimate dehydrogenase
MPGLAVLGQPIAHSRSPAMQSAALAELGLVDWSYEAIEVSADEFGPRVRGMAEAGFAGANVTLPHKLAALRIADVASDAAREIGAANTLTFNGGRIEAENTDATGFTGALGRPVDGLRALVLGAGGSARAVVWALTRTGAQVAIWNRTRSRAEQLAATLGARVADPDPPQQLLPTAPFDLIVNATSVGLSSAGPARQPATADLQDLHLALDSLTPKHVVVDLVYGSAETPLIAAARKRGAAVVDGLEVLVHQGAASLRIWTGREPPIEMMRRAAREAE